ncbi:hypothetical protein [Vulcanisaeta souniana]|uniref:Uncharacterized protein n=1 Tax=Vulcanisaeta souniana JCM 11219 TaxID=1293586 RepID=A0ABM8BL25_9CREN|nr:hypothetical protein [Vulcanisaeta souniana]BDR91681.1 hypothetical protein Vsou_07740 [Vulcanisaeta souniana JCM 11219]
MIEEVRINNLPCFINLSILNQGKVPEILIELSTGCSHYNAMIRVTRKFMKLFGVDTARIAAAKLARVLGIEDYEAVEHGDIELRLRKKPGHYPEWVNQNMDAVINAFNEVLTSLGIITQPAIQPQQEIHQEIQSPLSTPQQASVETLVAHVVKSYGNINGQNLLLRSLGENTRIELCLERMGSCKPLITVKANPLEITMHEDAVKAFGENRAIEYATWIANALYISNYEISELGNEIVLRSRGGVDGALTNNLIRVMDIIASKYLGRE